MKLRTAPAVAKVAVGAVAFAGLLLAEGVLTANSKGLCSLNQIANFKIMASDWNPWVYR